MDESKSLCKDLIELWVNIVALSSVALYLSEKHYTDRPLVVPPPIDDRFPTPPNSKFNKSERSEAKSLVMEPDAGETSPSSVYEDHIDDRATAVIDWFHERKQDEVNKEATNAEATVGTKRFHDKNSRDNTSAAPACLPFMLPTPPRRLKK